MGSYKKQKFFKPSAKGVKASRAYMNYHMKKGRQTHMSYTDKGRRVEVRKNWRN